MPAQRYTLLAPASYQAEIKKSRFLAQAVSIADADGALAYIRSASDVAASHNCWAYRVGQAYRFHDDGEPGGSAGKPILAAIDGQQLDGVAVVVTRWFGGTKLGVGGLIRAYGGTAAECLRRADRKPLVEMMAARLDCSYPELELLKVRIQALGVRIKEEDFGATQVGLSLGVPIEHVEELRQLVADITRGRSTLQTGGSGAR